MNSKIKSDASDPIKQRNFNLSDSTFKMLTDYADKVGLTNGAALTVILRERFSESEQPTGTGRVAREPAVQQVPIHTPDGDALRAAAAKEIALPPENVATFKGGKGKHLQAASEQPIDERKPDEELTEDDEARRARVRRAASERSVSALRGGDIDF